MGDATPDFETVDFFTDPSIIDDPYPYFDFLRESRGPVWLDDRYKVAYVSGHEEALDVFRDGDLYSSCNAATGPFTGVPIEPDGDDAGPLIDRCRAQMPMSEFMVSMDAPMHGEYRSFLTGFFVPRRLKENEAFMWRLADSQLDQMIESGRSEFVAAYASPFAGLVIADLLGVPEEDMHRFREGFDAMANFTVEDRQEIPDNPIGFIEDAFKAYLVERRQQPRDDILTHLAHVTFSDGSQPPVDALAREASFVFAAGQETTVRLMAFAARHIAEHPDVQQQLREHRELVPNFIEEMLRMEAPIKSYFRMARRTTTLGGVTIPAGTTVMLLPGASNRDPRRFEEPHRFDVARKNASSQLAFSRGVHSCIGQPLARTEARVTLERMLDRMENISILESDHGAPSARRYEYSPTYIFRGLMSLSLAYTPVDAAPRQPAP